MDQQAGCEAPAIAPVEQDPGAASTQSAAGRSESVSQPGPKILLTIAGLDPSSGAGLSADLKVFAAHGHNGVAAATALTVQSTAGVRRVEPVSSELLVETLDCLAEDLSLAGIKIGMLATAANVNAVIAFLLRLRKEPGSQTSIQPWVVLDPVIRSSSGHALLAPYGVERLRFDLLALVDCVTPNIDELYLLAGLAPRRTLTPASATIDEAEKQEIAEAAAALLRELPSLSLVVTGGHLSRPDDYLLCPGLPGAWLPGEWVHTRATHGTGCGYSSALLCGLVSGRTMRQAAIAAKDYVTAALRAAVPMGRGGGSMHHLYAMQPLGTGPVVSEEDNAGLEDDLVTGRGRWE